MKKGKFLILLPVMLFLLFAAFPANAAESAEISVETNTTAVAGGEFSVEIRASKNPGFTKLSLGLTHDQKYLTLVGVEPSERLLDMGAVFTLDKSTSKLPYPITIESSEEITGKNIVLFTATFKLSSSASLGSYKVGCSSIQMTGSDKKSISVTSKEGGVMIECEHKYSLIIDEVAPTCEDKGMTTYKCTECSVVNTVFTPALGHKYKETSRVPATCTEHGKIIEKCSTCGNVKTTSFGEPLGHSYDITTVIPSTCSAKGYTLHKCIRCDDEYKDSYTDFSDHTYTKKVMEEPTCYSEGYMRFTCTVCGNVRTEKMDKVDHNFRATMTKEPTHTERGWTAYECIFCGETKKDAFTDIVPYDLENIVVLEPTCTTDGLCRITCRDGCGYYTEQVLPATGHSYSDWHTDVSATAEKSGLKSRVCRLCKHEETEEIPPLGNSASVAALSPSQMVSAVLIATIVSITLVLVVVVFARSIKGPTRRRPVRR